MARSFLFPQDQPDAQTTRLIALAARQTGFMKGEPGAAGPGWYQPGGDNADMLAQLLLALQASYPDAGPAFWAVRMWTNLIWQPAYLAVIGAHMHGAVPDLRAISQARHGIFVDRYRLSPGPQPMGAPEALIAQAADQFKAFATALLAEINTHVRLKPLPARRLVADRFLSLMVWLNHKRHDLTNAQIASYADQWLAALDLGGQGTLEVIATPDREVLIVKRKGCCLDYLIDPGRLCASCPKQDDALRIARQTANALAELG